MNVTVLKPFVQCEFRIKYNHSSPGRLRKNMPNPEQIPIKENPTVSDSKFIC